MAVEGCQPRNPPLPFFSPLQITNNPNNNSSLKIHYRLSGISRNAKEYFEKFSI